MFSEGICRRGQEYARQEISNPARTLTSTVPVHGGDIAMVPVRAAAAIPKGLIMKAMEQVRSVTAEAPVEIGDTLLSDLAGTGVPLVATRSVHYRKEETSNG